ncbi:hypothetical protein AAVH_28714 [Aphelenchoides avenae]|nr:hypothetical protein AAVH_28714 [Aphelenchus avenae]
MSERNPSAESVNLIEQMLSIRNDPGKLLELLERQNVAMIGEAITRLLDIASVVEEGDMRRRKLDSRIVDWMLGTGDP